MPSLLSRLTRFFPGSRQPTGPGLLDSTPEPLPLPPETAEERRDRLIAQARRELEATPRRPRPSSEEKVPANYHGGVGGRVWFLPFSDSATGDSPEIRAAMRLMLRDAWVKAAWCTQVLSVSSENLQVHAAEPGNPESEEQARFFAACLNDHIDGGAVGLVNSIAMPLGPDGWGVCEKVWRVCERGPHAGRIVPAAVKPKDPEFLRLEGDNFRNVTHVQSLRAVGERFPISDFLYTRYLPVFDEPMGMAAFRASYAPYWMRDTVRKLRVIHHEKRMAGMLQGEYEDEDDKPALESALRQAKTATWIAVPKGCRVQAIALSTASEPDYKSFDESLREEIVTGVTFATLQMMQGNVPNARGNSMTQKQTSDLAPWLIMSLVQDTINRQLAPDCIDFNYPYAAGGYPKVTFGAVAVKEMLDLISVVEGAQRLGLTPSKKYYASALSIQQADPNDPGDRLELPGMGGGPMPGGEPEEEPEAEAFAEWKPYVNRATRRSGWISDGGLVRYTRPKNSEMAKDTPPTAPKKPEAKEPASGKKPTPSPDGRGKRPDRVTKPGAPTPAQKAQAKAAAESVFAKVKQKARPTAREVKALPGQLRSLNPKELKALKGKMGRPGARKAAVLEGVKARAAKPGQGANPSQPNDKKNPDTDRNAAPKVKIHLPTKFNERGLDSNGKNLSQVAVDAWKVASLFPSHRESFIDWASKMEDTNNTVTNAIYSKVFVPAGLTVHDTLTRSFRKEDFLADKRKRSESPQDFALRHYPELKEIKTLVIEGTGSDATKTHIHELFEMRDMAKAVSNRGVEIYISDKTVIYTDQMGHLKGIKPQGWDHDSRWDTVGGCYDPPTKKVLAGNGDGNGGDPKTITGGMVSHETGHAIGHVLKYDKSNELLKFHRSLFNTMEPYLKFDGVDGKEGRAELFAEGISIFVRNGKREVARTFSQDYANWLETVIKEVKNVHTKTP